tara:strand:- start:159 stop:1433 length:1275 start_codon:yes stop_codon:yes gene_type:complete
MAVTTTTTRAEKNGNGTAGPFQCGFRVLEDSDLDVYVDGNSTPKELDSDYTVANAGTETNATVTFTEGNYPASGTANVVLVRNVPYTQLTNYQNNTALDAETLEASFDKGTMQSQQLSTNTDRTIRYADTVTSVTTAETEISDVAADRADKILAFDSSGQLSATQEIGVWQGAWASGTTYSERDLIRQSDTGAVYICTTTHDAGATFTGDIANWSAVIDAGGFNVKLTANLEIGVGETYITPYKLDLNGYDLTVNGTLIVAEIITGDGTIEGSANITESGPIDLSSASLVTLTSTQELTNKTLTSPKINEDVVMSATATELNVMDAGATITTPTVASGDAFVMDDADVGMRQVHIDNVDTYLSQTSKTLTNKKIPEIDSDAAITLDATTYVELNADNGIIYMKDDSATILTIQLSGGNTTITGP